MTSSDAERAGAPASADRSGGTSLARSPQPAAPSSPATEYDTTRAAPAAPAAPPRPTLADKPEAPVIVKRPPPFSVQVAQLAWVLSLVAGTAVVVYLFIIRETQLPEIVTAIRAVDDTRAESTYTTAADIVYWTAFGLLVAILLLQTAFLVSFVNRRPRIRWWQLGSFLLLIAVALAIRELIAIGDRGIPLERLLLLQLGLALVALLFSVLPGALRWSARRHDVRAPADVTDSAL